MSDRGYYRHPTIHGDVVVSQVNHQQPHELDHDEHEQDLGDDIEEVE